MDGAGNATTECEDSVFRGTLLIVICGVGTILNIVVLLVLLLSKKILPLNQRITIINLAITDLILAVLGLFVRGPNFTDATYFDKFGGRDGVFCHSFAYAIMFSGYVNNVALLPISIDRYLVIVLPHAYTHLMKPLCCFLMVLCSWVPNLVFLGYELAVVETGNTTIGFDCDILRCAVHVPEEEFAKDMVCLVAPTVVIVFCYLHMGVQFYRIRNRMLTCENYTKEVNFMVTCTLVIIPSTIAFLPYLIWKKTSDPALVHLSYVIFYVIVVTNPVVYMMRLPRFGTALLAILRGRWRTDPLSSHRDCTSVSPFVTANKSDIVSRAGPATPKSARDVAMTTPDIAMTMT